MAPPPGQPKPASRRTVAILTAATAAILIAASLLAVLSDRGGGPTAVAPSPSLPAPTHSQHPGVHLDQLLAGDPRDRPGCGPPKLSGISSAWVVTWENDGTSPDLVGQQAKKLDLLDFFWLSLAGTSDIAVTDQYTPSVDAEMDTVHNASPCTLGFVTLADNFYMNNRPRNLDLMAKILMDPAVQWQFVLAVDQWMYNHPKVDGLTLDFEYGLPDSVGELAPYAKTGHWGANLTLRQEVDSIGLGYDRLVWSLARAVHKLHRQIRVAALTRPTDVIEKDHLSPFVLNYGNWPVDQVVLMAVDYHWSTGNPGPIAPFESVKHDVQYVLSYPGMNRSKLTIEVAAYAFNWQVGPEGLIAKAGSTPIEALDKSQTEIDSMLSKGGIHPLRTAAGDTHWQFIQDGQPHIVWDAATALRQTVAKLHQFFPGCGIAVFRVGNSDPAGWQLVQQAFSNPN